MLGPDRLGIDIVGSQLALPQQDYPGIDRGGVRGLRTSQYSAEVVRIVVELDAVVPYEIRRTEGGLWITFANPEGSFEPWTSASGELAPLSSESLRPVRAPVPERTSVRAPARAVEPQTQEMRRITIGFENTPILEVLYTFADFA